MDGVKANEEYEVEKIKDKRERMEKQNT